MVIVAEKTYEGFKSKVIQVDWEASAGGTKLFPEWEWFPTSASVNGQDITAVRAHLLEGERK